MVGIDLEIFLHLILELSTFHSLTITVGFRIPYQSFNYL
jgi:hypothetical protein